MHTLNFADLIPTNTIWTGAEKCPNPFYPQNSPALMYCVTNGSTPFRLNLSVRDLGHTLIFGPTGSGKSTLLATLAAQFRRYEGMHIYAFDKGMSMYPLTKAVGGQHFALGGSEETQLNFCPLQYLETASDQAWAAGWIEDILTLNGLKVSPMQRNAIADAIKTTSESAESKSLTEFLNNVQDNEIRDTLKPYTIAGLLGNLLDATSDGLDFSNFCTFEIEDLMNLNIKYSLPVLLYLFRRIEKNLKGQPSVIFLDEAWLMLGNDVFKEKIREWLKVLRKANCSVVMATQSLSDASNSGILDVITESTASKIFLANVYAKDEMNAKLYRSMGLNDRQIQIVSTMVPKRQYFYVSEEGRRLFELALGKLSLAFVGASDKDSIAKIKELEATWGEQWVYKWMEENYIDYRKYGEIK
jgi:type IV secretion system protein VirB4